MILHARHQESYFPEEYATLSVILLSIDEYTIQDQEYCELK